MVPFGLHLMQTFHEIHYIDTLCESVHGTYIAELKSVFRIRNQLVEKWSVQ